MDLLEKIFTSQSGMYIVMIGIIVLFVSLLRFLYGPKGIWRKNLWDGIDDDDNEIVKTTNDKENKQNPKE